MAENNEVPEGSVVVADEAAPEVVSEAPIEPAPGEMIPRARLNEVLEKQRAAEARAQMAEQREAQALAAWQAYQRQQQLTAPQQPQQQTPEDPATARFLSLLEQGVTKAVDRRFQSLEGKLQRFDAVAEHTEQQQFWSRQAVPEDLKSMTEQIYNQNKASMPNLTRDAALIYAQGLLYQQQQRAALTNAQASQEAMTKVNQNARAVTSPTTPARAPKKFEDLSSAEQEAYLRSEAEKGYLGGR